MHLLLAAAIVSVVVGAFPILTSSVFALAAAVLTGTLAPANAYSGFANGTILLIVVAFLVARAVVTCGLGERLGYVVVSVFGRSTLGLGYSIFLVDGAIAPPFPSNTARSGCLPARAPSGRGSGARRPDRQPWAASRFPGWPAPSARSCGSRPWPRTLWAPRSHEPTISASTHVGSRLCVPTRRRPASAFLYKRPALR
jgi:di/tricarboxylate transporter